MIVTYQREPRGDGGEGDPQWTVNPVDPNQTWHDPDDGSYVASVSAHSTMDNAGLLSRAQSIHARYPIMDHSTGQPYTDAALQQAVTDWITEAGAL